MLLFIFINFCLVLLKVGAQCGVSWCGATRTSSASFYPPYLQPLPTATKYQVPYTPVLPASQPALNLQYALPPSQISTQTSPPVLASIDSESALTAGKNSNYEDFEKELEQLHPVFFTKPEKKTDVKVDLAVLNETRPGVTTTYVREYQPVTFLPRPLPYRPVPYVPYLTGCNQYLMERGVPYTSNQLLVPQPSYVTAPPVSIRPPPILPPPINDCCGKCGAPCNFRYKKNIIALASKIFTSQFVPRREKEDEDEPKDPKCNSEKLRDLMNKYITRTVGLSKRLIQKYAEIELKGFFSVFCSTEDFSYVARSETFCQLQKNDILCYAFKHS